MTLPPGPEDGALVQTFRLHRDPVGMLEAARQRLGDVFTLRLATVRPLVVVTATHEVPDLVELPSAGQARRRILPMASARSIFGGDGDQHRAARARAAPALAPEAVAARRPAIEAIAAATSTAGRAAGRCGRCRGCGRWWTTCSCASCSA